MAKIILAEDDDFFRVAIKDLLESHGHKVTEAGDGKIARDIIKASAPFDLVVSDIQMPFLTGVELLEWVKANKPSPFILMTGFSHILETKRAHELGADEFLAKPFNDADLVDVIAKMTRPKSLETKPEQELAEFCKVSIDEFVASPIIQFDVYVQLGKKYIKIGRKGDQVPVERIRTYIDKGLKFLHVRKDDFRELVQFNLKIAKSVTKASGISKEKKINFIRYTGEVILEKAFVTEIDAEAFGEAKDFINSMMTVVAEEDEAFTMLDFLNSHSDHVYAHSVCVSIYATMIAKKVGWTSTRNLFILSLCGIFHDIGKKEIDREILEKPRPLLTQAERRLFESHTTRGKEILMALKSVPSEVVTVAYEHHEDNLNLGYPRGIGKLEIHPFTQILRVANVFADLSLKGPHREQMSPMQAIEYMKIHFEDGLDKAAFQALQTLFVKR